MEMEQPICPEHALVYHICESKLVMKCLLGLSDTADRMLTYVSVHPSCLPPLYTSCMKEVRTR